MNANFRPSRIWWVLGILLLVGSTLGANWALNGTLLASITTPGQTEKPHNNTALQVITALGMVDIDGGVVSLYPVQQGRIEEVAREGIKVKKGDVLLRLDSRLQRYQLDEARAALAAATAQLNKANNAAKQHQNLIEQQKVAEMVAKHKKSITDQQVMKFNKLNEGTEFDGAILITQDKLAQEAVAAEALKTRALELLKADLQNEIQRALADVDAKDAQIKRAQFALDECNLLAPADGLVLRVTVSAGEVIGPNPTQAAMTFCPNAPRIVRAEILQEWANLVHVGQKASIKDDTQEGETWTGSVRSISDWIAPKRQKIIEPFMFNDVRTLECLIELDPYTPLRIGQRVRVRIDTTPPTKGYSKR